MEITKSTREFRYNGVALQDLPGATLEEVRAFYATLYPEIVNAAIEGPTMAGPKTVYEFRRAVGTKGAPDVAERVDAMLARRKERAMVAAVPRHDARLHGTVAFAAVHWRTPDGADVPAAVLAPSRALPLLP